MTKILFLSMGMNLLLCQWSEKRVIFEVSLLWSGNGADAVPHYQKLRTRVIHIWDNRKGQPNRSAMERPRPGGTALVITVTPVPGKYAGRWFGPEIY